MSYFCLSPGDQSEHQPAVRLDYNLSDKHRLTGTYNHFFEIARAGSLQRRRQRFPGVAQLPAGADDAADALDRAALDAVDNLVSELRGGITRGERLFFGRPEQGRADDGTFDDTNGYALDLDREHRPDQLAHRQHAVVAQRLSVHVDETLNWQKGKHSITIGGGGVPRPGVGRLAAAGAGHRSRLRHDQRSGRRPVHHGELPGRVGGAARPTRASSTRC